MKILSAPCNKGELVPFSLVPSSVKIGLDESVLTSPFSLRLSEELLKATKKSCIQSLGPFKSFIESHLRNDACFEASH